MTPPRGGNGNGGPPKRKRGRPPGPYGRYVKIPYREGRPEGARTYATATPTDNATAGARLASWDAERVLLVARARAGCIESLERLRGAPFFTRLPLVEARLAGVPVAAVLSGTVAPASLFAAIASRASAGYPGLTGGGGFPPGAI